MVQPRFKKYTEMSRSREPGPKPSIRPGISRGFVVLLVIVFLGIVGWAYLRTVAINTSTAGQYIPPTGIGTIEPYSRARWFLADCQGDLLTADLGWYHRSQLSPARTVAELDSSGFRPFLFVDQAGSPVNIFDSGRDLGAVEDSFYYQIVLLQGTNAGYTKHRSVQNTNLFKEQWLEGKDETVLVNPQTDTSIHGQFLPDAPQFTEEYMCYLSQVWEEAARGYIEIYQRPPSSLQDLMDGIGLVPNPDCVWPFEENQRLSVNCEGGIIDGKIVYWRVTHADGGRRGMARYWDQYTTYDDPDTPVNIVTAQTTSSVVDPSLIEGTFHVMFTDEIMKNLLGSVRPLPVEEEPQ